MGVVEHGQRCKCEPCEVQRILDVLCEPVGLDGSDLPSYDKEDMDVCSNCHRGPRYKYSRKCIYCFKLDELEKLPKPRKHKLVHLRIRIPAGIVPQILITFVLCMVIVSSVIGIVHLLTTGF